MTKISIPNKPGDFEIDGVSIIILPDKVIVDTGGKKYGQKDTAHRPEKKKRTEIINGDTGMPEGGLIGALFQVKDKFDQRKKKE